MRGKAGSRAYDSLISELCKDADQAAWFVGFLASVVDNPEVSIKVNDSLSGYAVATARAAVSSAVVLYVARAWDKSSDAISIRRAHENLPSLKSLNARRKRRLVKAGIDPSDVKSLKEPRKEFVDAYAAAEKRPYHPTLRLLRTEHFAHRILEPSNDRKKLIAAGVDIPIATYADLLELAMETLSLVGQAQYLWTQVANPYSDMVDRYADRCREFWSVLPVLHEVESPNLR